MSQGLTKLFAAIRDAEAHYRDSSDTMERLPLKHQKEIALARQNAETAYGRKALLEETLRLVIHENMTVEQAKMVAHESRVENPRRF